jgi:hypothetical protein
MGLFMWGTISDKRMGLSFKIAAGPAGLMTVFYLLRFKITWRARSPYSYPPGTVWPSYTPRHWVPFSSLPTTCRTMVEVSEPAFTLALDCQLLCWPCYITILHSSSIITLGACCCRNLFIEPLPSNNRLFWLHHSNLQPLCHNIFYHFVQSWYC